MMKAGQAERWMQKFKSAKDRQRMLSPDGSSPFANNAYYSDPYRNRRIGGQGALPPAGPYSTFRHNDRAKVQPYGQPVVYTPTTNQPSPYPRGNDGRSWDGVGTFTDWPALLALVGRRRPGPAGPAGPWDARDWGQGNQFGMDEPMWWANRPYGFTAPR